MVDKFFGWVYPITMSEKIAIKVKEIRRRINLTQVELAKLAGTSNSYVAHLEKGAMMPSLEFAFKIEKALKITDGELSNLVIDFIRGQAGFLSEPKNFPLNVTPEKKVQSPFIDSLHLKQDCPSCGEKVNLNLTFAVS